MKRNLCYYKPGDGPYTMGELVSLDTPRVGDSIVAFVQPELMKEGWDKSECLWRVLHVRHLDRIGVEIFVEPWGDSETEFSEPATTPKSDGGGEGT